MMSSHQLDLATQMALDDLRARNNRLDAHQADISTTQSRASVPTSGADTSASSASANQREQQGSFLLRPTTTDIANRPFLARASRSATRAQETAFAESLRVEEAHTKRLHEEREAGQLEEQSAEIQRKAWEEVHSHFSLG
jgi:hypothetical protein